MIHFINENFLLISILTIAILLLKCLLPRYAHRLVRYLERKQRLNFFRQITFIIFVIMLIVLQLKYRIISISVDSSIIIGIFTIYGIFLAFLQFSIGFAVQNKDDKVWGKSITKQFVQQHIPLSILRSPTFIIILVFIAVFPFLADSLFKSNEQLAFIEPSLTVIWETSVFTVFMFYILLFIRTISVIEKFFDIQEDDNIFIEYRIKENITEQYNRLFLHFFPQETYLFTRALFNSLKKLPEVEKIDMFLRIYHHVLNELATPKVNVRKITDVTNLISSVLMELENEKIKLTTIELLEISKKHDSLLSTWYKQDEDKKQNDFPDTYFENSMFAPKIIWDSVQSIKDLDLIDEYFKGLYFYQWFMMEDSKRQQYTKKFFGMLLDQYCTYQNQIPHNHTFYGRNTLFSPNKVNQEFAPHILSYILRLEHNSETRQFLKLLSNPLHPKYCVAFILYYVLYPGNTKWKNEIVLFREIIQKHDFQTFDEETVQFIKQTIKQGNIDHRITEGLLNRVIKQLNTSELDQGFLQFCLEQIDFSLADFIKLKFIFSNNERGQLANFSTINLSSIKSPNANWNIDFLYAFIDEPDLMKQESIRATIANFCKNILQSNYRDITFFSDDFRIFYINEEFRFTEEQFERLMKGKMHVGKGIINYLLLHSLGLDHEKLSYLKERIYLLLDNDNITLDTYVQNLVDRAEECGEKISIIKQQMIIEQFKNINTHISPLG